jgi:hypothetical protein
LTVHRADFSGKPLHIGDVIFLQEVEHLCRRFEVGDFGVISRPKRWEIEKKYNSLKNNRLPFFFPFELGFRA